MYLCVKSSIFLEHCAQFEFCEVQWKHLKMLVPFVQKHKLYLKKNFPALTNSSLPISTRVTQFLHFCATGIYELI